MSRTSYVELPTADLAASKAFYEAAFGWSMTGFGPTYASTMTGDVDVGLQADTGDMTRAPLPVISVDNLEATLRAVTEAGGTVVKAIFSFPGGRRFQFLDPHGNEIAAMLADPN